MSVSKTKPNLAINPSPLLSAKLVKANVNSTYSKDYTEQIDVSLTFPEKVKSFIASFEITFKWSLNSEYWRFFNQDSDAKLAIVFYSGFHSFQTTLVNSFAESHADKLCASVVEDYENDAETPLRQGSNWCSLIALPNSGNLRWEVEQLSPSQWFGFLLAHGLQASSQSPGSLRVSYSREGMGTKVPGKFCHRPSSRAGRRHGSETLELCLRPQARTLVGLGFTSMRPKVRTRTC